MRIFLKESKQVGEVLFPSSGFYEVSEEQAAEWIDAGVAVPANDENQIVKFSAIHNGEQY